MKKIVHLISLVYTVYKEAHVANHCFIVLFLHDIFFFSNSILSLPHWSLYHGWPENG